MPRYGGASPCGRCSKPVYPAEERLGAGRSWHFLKCFTCKNCNKTLESTTLTEHKESREIYCKTCYGKIYGPKGYGYGAGGGTLSMDTGSNGYAKNTAPMSELASRAKYIGGNECGRCGGSVYEAESQMGAGLYWHKSCFLCKACNKRLDSTNLQENTEEQEIFCQGCYNKYFGPKGYGFGQGAGVLSNTGKSSAYQF